MRLITKILKQISKFLQKLGLLTMYYTADFETTTDPDDCRVWAWGVCSIDSPDDFIYGIDLDEFMDFCEHSKNARLYFHNLKFDGEFILCWLFANGFTLVTDKKEITDKSFMTLISDTGLFYAMTIYWKAGKKQRKVTLYDSLKVLPFSVKAVAKAFGLPINKLEIDYHEKRPKGHELTAMEVKYLNHDVKIMALALKQLFDQDLTAMTTGSNALKNYKETLGRFQFERVFPTPEHDADIRQSYKGGFTWLKPEYAGKDIGAGIVLDVNSLYPAVMKYCPMPYGEPRYFEGQYKENRLYNLYVQMIRCSFELKPGRVPTIQMKGNLSFVPTEYVSSSAGLEVALCLTSVDLALFLEQYEVMNLEYISGWMFKSKVGLFDEYIDKWTAIKTQATIDGNKAMRTLAKLMLNSLYGKFALSPLVRSRYPVYRDGVISYSLGPQETRSAIYIPVGTFITSWARNKTIRAAQLLYDRFIYADTDSLHLLGTEIPQQLMIDDVELGFWKHETTFSQARFIRAKTYMEYGKDPKKDEPESWKVTCAGMPEKCHEQVTFDNFKPGSRYTGKLVPRHVKGGIVLVDTEFTIRKEGKEDDHQANDPTA